jgi:hypothetical protein
MDVTMHCRHGQALADLLARSQVAGDKLPDRLRSTSLAMLAVPAAIGLAFVAVVLQQGWPSVLGGPIPTFSSQRSQGDAATSGPLSVSKGVAARPQAHARHSSVTAAASPGGGTRSGDSAGAHRLSRGHHIGPTSPGPAAAEQPVEGAPAAEPAEPSPAVTPTPASNPAAATVSPAPTPAATAQLPGHGGKGKGAGAAKSESHGRGKGAAKSESHATGKSAPVAPVPPELPHDEESETPAPVSEGPGSSGHGHGYGHYK